MASAPFDRGDESVNEPRIGQRYDLWLDKYADILETSADTPIIDLGCGSGNDSLYLTRRGLRVISCDISETALRLLREKIPDAETMVMDMLSGLPFGDASAKVLIADLCLHYFPWMDTQRIVNDIKRVLSPDGFLLCRLNSTADFNYGAGGGTEIERHFYALENACKRFFDSDDITRLFQGWNILSISEYRMERFGLPKMLWDIALQKESALQ